MQVNAENAFDQVFRKYYAVLVLFARKMTRNRPAAEDIVTDVFCKLWQRQVHFDTSQQAKAFLFISTRNACVNFLQREASRAGVHNNIRERQAGQSGECILNQLIRAEVYSQVLELVNGLPAQCRKVMRLSFLSGYTNRQIAQKLQLSINTVRNQRARGIHLLRKRLSPCLLSQNRL